MGRSQLSRRRAHDNRNVRAQRRRHSSRPTCRFRIRSRRPPAARCSPGSSSEKGLGRRSVARAIGIGICLASGPRPADARSRHCALAGQHAPGTRARPLRSRADVGRSPSRWSTAWSVGASTGEAASLLAMIVLGNLANITLFSAGDSRPRVVPGRPSTDGRHVRLRADRRRRWRSSHRLATRPAPAASMGGGPVRTPQISHT